MSDENISYKNDKFYLDPIPEEERKNLKEGSWNTYLTKEEIKLLWTFISHQHVGYDNLELIKLVRKISSIANDDL